jgi:hypothetical protein
MVASKVVLKNELRELLRELCAATGAAASQVAQAPSEAAVAAAPAASPVRVAGSDDEEPASHALAVPIGGGAELRAWFDGPEQPPDPNGRAAALERTARAIRALARRWDVSDLPLVAHPEAGRAPQKRVHERIEVYLTALVASLGMRAAVVTRHGQAVASAGLLGDLERARLAFTQRRVAAEAERLKGRSSHADIAGDDFYAVSFFYDACLVCYFDSAFSLDFVRHRSRQVTRELSQLFSLLDDPDLDPIQVAPRPDV